MLSGRNATLEHVTQNALRALLFVGTALLCVLPMSMAYPTIGFDYLYFLPRLADTHLYLVQNGPSIHWWTATFGGGLPVFPNPQDLQLSLPQWLAFVLDPFDAVRATLLIVTLCSAYALYRHARTTLGWDEAAACLLAVAGSTGGFLTLRMCVGQASYHAIALTPVLLLLATDRGIRPRVAIPCAALVGSYFVYSGGYFVSFAAVLSLAIAVPLVRLLGPRSRPLLPAVGVLLAAASLALMLCAAKLFAVASWMSAFPRIQPTQPLPSLLSPVLQLLATPVVTLAGIGGRPSEFHRSLFEQYWGPWETDASFSIPIVLAALAALPLLVPITLRRGTPSERGLVCLCLSLVVLMIVATSARSPLHALIEQLPGMSNFRVNVRFAAVFALPGCLLGVFALSRLAARWFHGRNRSAVLWALVGLVLLQQAGYMGVVARHAENVGVKFDAGPFLAHTAQPGGTSPGDAAIREVAVVTDPVAVMTSRSSLRVYEPLLGSFADDNRHFWRRTPLRPGPPDEIRDGGFNMHLPPAFVYSQNMGMPPYTRIPADQRENLDRLLARGQPDWPLPIGQRIANAASLTAAIATAGWLLLVCLRPSWRARRRRTNE
jgi:hypothetical protein